MEPSRLKSKREHEEVVPLPKKQKLIQNIAQSRENSPQRENSHELQDQNVNLNQEHSLSSSHPTGIIEGFDSLSNDNLNEILHFVGLKSNVQFARVNKRCREIFNIFKIPKESYVYAYAPVDVLKEKHEGYRRENNGGYSLRISEMIAKCAVSYNRQDVLNWPLQDTQLSILSNICSQCCFQGRLDILRHYFDTVDPNDKERSKTLRSSYYCTNAAGSGHLDILKYLRSKGCDWHAYAYDAAKSNGHTEVVKYLRKHGCHKINPNRIWYSAYEYHEFSFCYSIHSSDSSDNSSCYSIYSSDY